MVGLPEASPQQSLQSVNAVNRSCQSQRSVAALLAVTRRLASMRSWVVAGAIARQEFAGGGLPALDLVARSAGEERRAGHAAPLRLFVDGAQEAEIQRDVDAPR